jgi:iron(III) transport system ATP-binding protein
VVQPAVLLLDEPLSNLDAALREEMRFEIRRLHDEFRITTVYVTHDQGEAMVTSDRIAVMNEGRIEQVDAPFALYNRPKTRFVAGFIGRTNLIPAVRKGGDVSFGGFVLPAATLHGVPTQDGPFTVSVRPEAIAMDASGVAATGARLDATIAERAYLGDHWDYVAAIGDLHLRVLAPPRAAFDAGAPVTLTVDPADMVAVA